MQNRITDNYLDYYAQYFYSQLRQLEDDLELLRRQTLFQLQEQNKIVAAVKDEDDEESDTFQDLKIRVAQPLANRYSQEWQRTRPSVRLMDRVGIRKCSVSTWQFLQLTRLNLMAETVQGKVDCGSSRSDR